MGWSCTARAQFALEYINETVCAPLGKGSNSLPGGAFYEIGREKEDGSITGTVWKPTGDDVPCLYHETRPNGLPCGQCGGLGRVPLMRRWRTFRIEADGTVSRFPGLDRATREAAKASADARYVEVFAAGQGR